MVLTIHWNTRTVGEETSIEVATEFAVFRLSMSGAVIRHTEWLGLPARPRYASETALQRQIRRHLEGPDAAEMRVELLRQGSAFSQRVWSELCNIPFGATLTYGQLARRVGSGARAVAGACRSNPFPGLIPCHRVVSGHGIGGFMGQTDGPYVELKSRILAYETANKR